MVQNPGGVPPLNHAKNPPHFCTYQLCNCPGWSGIVYKCTLPVSGEFSMSSAIQSGLVIESFDTLASRPVIWLFVRVGVPLNFGGVSHGKSFRFQLEPHQCDGARVKGYADRQGGSATTCIFPGDNFRARQCGRRPRPRSSKTRRVGRTPYRDPLRSGH